MDTRLPRSIKFVSSWELKEMIKVKSGGEVKRE
jgi:hypothetical protein